MFLNPIYENVNKNIESINSIIHQYNIILSRFNILSLVNENNHKNVLNYIKTVQINEEEFERMNNVDDSMSFIALKTAILIELEEIG
jgi:hypothetical protein